MMGAPARRPWGRAPSGRGRAAPRTPRKPARAAVDAGPGAGWTGRIVGGRGVWLEVEVGGDVAEDRVVLADVGAGVGAAVGGGIEARAVDEVVLDELRVGVEAEDLVVDVALLGVRADHDPGDAEAEAVAVDDRRHDVVVEAAPVIPGEEDRGAVPVGALHDRVDQAGDVGLAGADERRRVLRDGAVRVDPRDRRQGAVLGRGEEVRQRLDVAELVVLGDVGERRQRVPDPGRLRSLLDRRARHRGVVLAVGLGALEHVVGPGDVLLVQQVGDVGPGVQQLAVVRGREAGG